MKILLFVLLAVLFICMVTQVYLGITIARGERRIIRKHRRFGRKFFAAMLASIAIVEYSVRLNGGVQQVDKIFHIHVYSSILFVVTLILLNWFFTGLNKRKVHKPVAYLSLVLFLIMVGTAIPIILRL